MMIGKHSRPQAIFSRTIVGILMLAFCAYAAADRVTDGLVVGYDFREQSGTIVGDHSGNGSPLDLTIHDPDAVTWGDGSITFNAPTIISSASGANVASEGSATKLFEELTSTDEITLEAWITPDNVEENGGPARIMTMSIDRTNRNFTLGQDQIEYEARVRTETTDNNGNSIKARTDEGPADVELQHVVYRLDSDGEPFIFVNGEEMQLGLGNLGEAFIEGGFSNWNDSYDFALGNELTWGGNVEPIDFRDFLGTMHLIAVYNRALSDAEIAANFGAGASAAINGGQIAGDFDNNGVLGLADVNELSSQIASGNADTTFDLNGDSDVNLIDLSDWVTDLKNTWFGDANLDGEFNSSDLVAVFEASKFEQEVDAGWHEGDWNGDLRFSSGDFVQAFQDGGFERGPQPATIAVPEPITGRIMYLLIGVSVLAGSQRSRSQRLTCLSSYVR